MMKRNIKKGFTLIELLMVVAIVAILSAIILIGLNSSREKAAVAKYTSYATQMYRLTADAVAAGYLDAGTLDAGFVAGTPYCFGAVDKCWPSGVSNSAELDAALTKLSDYPTGYDQDDIHSPFNSNYGVTVGMNSTQTSMRLQMYVMTGDDNYVQKICTSMNWEICASNSSCCVDVPLSTRFQGGSGAASAGDGL